MGSSLSIITDENTNDSSVENQCYMNGSPKKTVYEWHLNDKDDSALRKAKHFRLEYEKLYNKRHPIIDIFLRQSKILQDSVYAIQYGYLINTDFSKDEAALKEIIKDLALADENDDPRQMPRAYSRAQKLSEKINSDMAKNTYHQLSLYCTPLNCNVLAHTHDGIQAFITILFHPKLDQYLCTESCTLYRGSVIQDESVLEGYQNGSIIITTTFLSTSELQDVANVYSQSDPAMPNQISLSCRYEIHNYRRHTALRMREFSKHPAEEEILIYPYVPFKILSITEAPGESPRNKRINVHMEEIEDCDPNNRQRQPISTTSINL